MYIFYYIIRVRMALLEILALLVLMEKLVNLVLEDKKEIEDAEDRRAIVVKSGILD